MPGAVRKPCELCSILGTAWATYKVRQFPDHRMTVRCVNYHQTRGAVIVYSTTLTCFDPYVPAAPQQSYRFVKDCSTVSSIQPPTTPSHTPKNMAPSMNAQTLHSLTKRIDSIGGIPTFILVILIMLAGGFGVVMCYAAFRYLTPEKEPLKSLSAEQQTYMAEVRDRNLRNLMESGPRGYRYRRSEQR